MEAKFTSTGPSPVVTIVFAASSSNKAKQRPKRLRFLLSYFLVTLRKQSIGCEVMTPQEALRRTCKKQMSSVK